MSAGVIDSFRELREVGHQLEILFFDATDDTLIRRFSETRRRHPAAENGTVPDGIRIERERLATLRQNATRIIDTSEFNVHQLKEQVIRLVRGEEGSGSFTVELLSFGFRYGIPTESSMVMDVRFLPNPHFVPELRLLTGLDAPVRSFVEGRAETVKFSRMFWEMLDFLIPSYRREGKTYLTIAIGCTGGHHRSVALVEMTAEHLRQAGVDVRVNHRDIEKG
jgi:UPF0042 nucleotide-binding protein